MLPEDEPQTKESLLMTVASSSPPSRLRPRRAEGATSKLKIREARGAGDDGALAANPPNAQMAAGKAATAFDGAWLLSTYYGAKGLDVGTARTPVGPTGKRATMMNGLADSVSKGARNKAGARKRVAYLASDACQTVVGRYGIVFPATRAGTKAAVAAYEKRGVDTTAFTQPVADKKDFTTFSFPITNYAADVYALMRPAMQDLYANDAPVSGLDETNSQINVLLHQ